MCTNIFTIIKLFVHIFTSYGLRNSWVTKVKKYFFNSEINFFQIFFLNFSDNAGHFRLVHHNTEQSLSQIKGEGEGADLTRVFRKEHTLASPAFSYLVEISQSMSQWSTLLSQYSTHEYILSQPRKNKVYLHLFQRHKNRWEISFFVKMRKPKKSKRIFKVKKKTSKN